MHDHTTDMVDGELDSAVAEDTSILAHARAFGDNDGRTEAPASADADTDPAGPHPSAQQKRDKDTGQFAEGKRRNAKSHQATADDVEAINTLTRRIKDAEERLGKDFTPKEGESPRVQTLRRRAELLERMGQSGNAQAMSADADRIARLERELAALRSESASPAKLRAAEARVDQAGGDSSDPEPDENDPKYAGDWTKFNRDLIKWEARNLYRSEREREQREASARESFAQFETRVQAARQKHQNFDQIADRVIQRVPQGSVLEQFFFTRPDAEDVVVYLDAHPQEFDEILRTREPINQIALLSMVSHRLSSTPTAPSAGTTTAATARSTYRPAPKPPTVVRPEAQRSTETDSEESSSVMAHAKRYRPRP